MRCYCENYPFSIFFSFFKQNHEIIEQKHENHKMNMYFIFSHISNTICVTESTILHFKALDWSFWPLKLYFGHRIEDFKATKQQKCLIFLVKTLILAIRNWILKFQLWLFLFLIPLETLVYPISLKKGSIKVRDKGFGMTFSSCNTHILYLWNYVMILDSIGNFILVIQF